MGTKATAPDDDLEALFDRIAAERVDTPPAATAKAVAAARGKPVAAAPAKLVAAAPAKPVAAAAAPPSAPVDDDLEALFDRVSAERETSEQLSPPPEADPGSTHVFQRVGQLTRTLHDALRELGYDKKLESAANSLPDARDRLAYIASLTGQAAERVLGAVERGQALQQNIDSQAVALRDRWQKLYAKELSVEEFKLLAGETRDFLTALPQQTTVMNEQLHEIMMAQDFHDLTGQVIKKIGELAHTLETNLVALLLETRPGESAEAGWLNGPAMRAEGRTDVVANQAQVDQLLESLGF